MKSLSEVALDCMVCAPRFGLHFEPTWRYVGGKFVVGKGLEQAQMRVRDGGFGSLSPSNAG